MRIKIDDIVALQEALKRSLAVVKALGQRYLGVGLADLDLDGRLYDASDIDRSNGYSYLIFGYKVLKSEGKATDTETDTETEGNDGIT